MSSLKLYRIHEHKNVEKLNGLAIVENLFNFIFEKQNLPIRRSLYWDEKRTQDHIPVGLAVRICGFHPQGPGWTPGLGNLLLF